MTDKYRRADKDQHTYTKRHADLKTGRHIGRNANSTRYRHAHGHKGTWTDRHTYTQIDMLICKQTHRYASMQAQMPTDTVYQTQTYKQTQRQTGRQAGRQAV